MSNDVMYVRFGRGQLRSWRAFEVHDRRFIRMAYREVRGPVDPRSGERTGLSPWAAHCALVTALLGAAPSTVLPKEGE